MHIRIGFGSSANISIRTSTEKTIIIEIRIENV